MYFIEPCEPSCPIPNQNIPAPLAPGAGGGGGGAGGGAGPSSAVAPSASGSTVPAHHSPYDLRRKSPSHHEGGPSTSAATAGSPTSPATPTAPAQICYASTMLPARKRPRRTCSASYDSKISNLLYLNYQYN